uniref:Uncharacterized protein n=1 Tax=Haematobia irritans TaxID=7368 RepID=A0A1L8EBI4_HAEIR
MSAERDAILSESFVNENPKVTNYIIEIEKKLEKYETLETDYRELDAKYLDVQEDMFGMNIKKFEYEAQIQCLTKENEKLRLENKKLTEEMEKFKRDMVAIYKTNGVRDKIACEAELSNNKNNATTVENDTNYANSILIKNFPQKLIHDDIKKSIEKLGKYMKLPLSDMDISKATRKESKFYERLNMQPDTLILIVEFKDQEMKVNFLKRKEMLKTHKSCKEIEITDFVSEDVYNLYQYAKVLKSHGYNSVYWRNNCVYVKKNRSTNCEPILIESQSQVDVLKSLNQ